jgi:hypothetical protein
LLALYPFSTKYLKSINHEPVRLLQESNKHRTLPQ